MYHAAGRAVGGCPIYVSDKPDGHNFDVLRKLVLPDGSVLRGEYPGRPTRDCLFADPTNENVLLKIWNRVKTSGEGGIIGAFHARYGEGIGPISGMIRPSDVGGEPELLGKRFAVFAHHANELRVLGRDEAWEITLDPLTAEVFSVAPVDDDYHAIGVIGLTNLFNSQGAISWHGSTKDACEVALMTGGDFAAWCEDPPTAVFVDGEAASFLYAPATGRLNVPVVDASEWPHVRIEF
jgi:raffinose synthase